MHASVLYVHAVLNACLSMPVLSLIVEVVVNSSVLVHRNPSCHRFEVLSCLVNTLVDSRTIACATVVAVVLWVSTVVPAERASVFAIQES